MEAFSRTKSFGTHVYNTPNNTSTKLQLQRIKLHIEIVNLKPVIPTTILLHYDWPRLAHAMQFRRDAQQTQLYTSIMFIICSTLHCINARHATRACIHV